MYAYQKDGQWFFDCTNEVAMRYAKEFAPDAEYTELYELIKYAARHFPRVEMKLEEKPPKAPPKRKTSTKIQRCVEWLRKNFIPDINSQILFQEIVREYKEAGKSTVSAAITKAGFELFQSKNKGKAPIFVKVRRNG